MPRSNKVPKEIAKYILNCLPSPTPERDWGIDVALAAGVHAPAAAIPPAKDLRTAWWSIGDQGSTGSCVGWGTAEGVLRWHFVKAGKLGLKDAQTAGSAYAQYYFLRELYGVSYWQQLSRLKPRIYKTEEKALKSFAKKGWFS